MTPGIRSHLTTWTAESAAIVLYEDFRSGCLGKAFVEWIGASRGSAVEDRLGLWRFDILELPGVGDEVYDGLTRADLLVISIRSGGDVPEAVSAKVAEWGGRLVDPTLPIVVLGGVWTAEAPMKEGLRRLRRWAGRLGMPLVCQSVWPPPDVEGWSPGTSAPRLAGVTAGLSRAACKGLPTASAAPPFWRPASFQGSGGGPRRFSG